MNLLQIIDDIAQVEPEVYARFDGRRAAFRHFLGFGKKVTAAALPLAVSSLFGKAYGQTTSLPPDVVNTLNLALQLEYLEYYYYDTALKSRALALTAEETAAITIILNDEKLHIDTLKEVLKSTAYADPTRAGFDYGGSQNGRRQALFPSLGGTAGLFTDKAVFMQVAQSLEDTGVRAYKGSVASLFTQKELLEAALSIHSVEARHAARIRSLRRGGIQRTTAPKSWVEPTETPASPPLPNNGVAGTPKLVGPYNAGASATAHPPENNVRQGTPAVDVQALGRPASPTAGAEAFDEPLDSATVKAIAKNFAANPLAIFK